MAITPQVPSSNVTSPKRIPALDGLRGLAILMVVFQHFYFMGWKVPFEKYSPWAGKVLGKLTLISAHGVDLFFVLSGFLITGILLDSLGRDSYFKNFYIRRTLRIFPLYYGVLAAVFLIVPLVRNLRLLPFSQQGFYWLFLGNLYPDIPTPGVLLRHFWSLAVQEQFYLLLPLIVFLLSRKALRNLLLVAVLITPLIRLALDLLDVPYFWFLLPSVADQLAAGGLVAVWMREAEAAQQLKAWAARSWIFIVPLVVAVMAIPRGWLDPWLIPLPHSVVTLAWASGLGMVLTTSSTSVYSRALSSRFLGMMGKYSFGMYVFHYLFTPQYAQLLSYFGFFNPVPPSKFVFLAVLAAGLLGTFVLAWLSWHLYEKHFLKLNSSKNVPTSQRANAPPNLPIFESSNLPSK